MSLFSSFGNYLFGVPEPSSQPDYDQAAKDQATANAYAAREQSDYNNEAGLAAKLNNTINGTAPSAADLQLQQTLQQELANNTAMGAGGNGTSGVLARYLAATQQGQQQAAAAQAGALLRAKEVQAAQQQQAGLFANMNNSSSNLFGTNAGLGLDYNKLGSTIDEQNAQRAMQTEAAGLQALTGAGSLIFGGPPTGGAAGAAYNPSAGATGNAGFWSNPINNAYSGAFKASSTAGA